MSNSPLTTVWFYNSISGSVISEPALFDTVQAHLPGWHGPFASKQAALDFYTANKAKNPGWKAPTGIAGNVTNTVTGGASDAAKNLLGLPTFQNLRPFMVRVMKVVIGTGLIITGLTMLVKQETNIKLTDIAKVAAL